MNPVPRWAVLNSFRRLNCACCYCNSFRFLVKGPCPASRNFDRWENLILQRRCAYFRSKLDCIPSSMKTEERKLPQTCVLRADIDANGKPGPESLSAVASAFRRTRFYGSSELCLLSLLLRLSHITRWSWRPPSISFEDREKPH